MIEAGFNEILKQVQDLFSKEGAIIQTPPHYKILKQFIRESEGKSLFELSLC